MNKTPYEIRLEALLSARCHLVDKYHANYEKLRDYHGNTPNKNMAEMQYPTEDEIFTLAEKFKSFIDSK